MKLIAVKAMRYAGTDLQPGDEFEAANERDARTLKAIRKARDADIVPAAPPATTYQTRRMKAKD